MVKIYESRRRLNMRTKLKNDYIVTDREGNSYLLEQEKDRMKSELMNQFVKLRKEKNITQQILAERTGIARPNIARMENGTYNPTVDMLVRMADGIGMQVEIKWIRRE